MQKDKALQEEYSEGVLTIRQACQQHTAFCLLRDFDQIRQTDLVTVHCCNCGATYKVHYDNIAMSMFCENCKQTEVTKEHLTKLQQRLQTIRKKLVAY